MPDAVKPTMTFDRGTIVVRACSNFDASSLPGVVWDSRIGGWRASAHRLHEIRAKVAQLTLASPSAPNTEFAQPSRWHPLELRPYQRAALTAWTLNAYRGVVVLPTGAGKTRVALAAASQRNGRTLCLVPTRVLLEQWVKQIRELYDGPIGVYGDGERTLQDVTVATYASAWRHMAAIGQSFELLVVDEAHHFGDAVQDEILEMSTAQWRLGLTATPTGNAEAARRLGELLGPVVYTQSIADLAGTYLADFESFVWLLPLTPAERRAYDRDMGAFQRFSSSVREHYSQATWQDLVRIAKNSPGGLAAMTGYRRARALVALTEGKVRALLELVTRHQAARILIFTADTTTAYRLSRYLLVPALTADIKRAERDRVIAAFRQAALPVLISCRVLNEGVDVPDADIAIIVGGTAGEREHVQRIGRVLRPVVGKVACVYELVAEDTFEVRQANRRREGLGGARKRS